MAHRITSLNKSNLLVLMTSILAIHLSAHSNDFADSSPAERVRTCKSLGGIAKAASEKAKEGKDVVWMLKIVEEGIEEDGIGPVAAHLMRTTARGAFVNIDMTPEAYARKVRRACMEFVAEGNSEKNDKDITP